jgi:hypothetical protein
MLKKALLIAAGLALLVLPLVVRWFYHYEGQYQPGPVPRPDLSQIAPEDPELDPFADKRTLVEPGAILVDMAHDNRVEMAELNVLQARLAARGQRLEPVMASEGSSDLADKLRYAKALLVISPGMVWTQMEIRQAEDFVSKGGRLLLAADPTRFGVVLDEEGVLVGVDSDVSYINDLAARFGLVFQPDYLYNTVENEGNFRNIRLTDFAEHELTEGLNQIVFSAVHSIESTEPALITTSGETRSSDTERPGDLVVATLAADGQVLGLGDLTFMTEPYNDAYDNDRFIANVADFLSGAQREYDLADFPFFFGKQAHLVFAGDPLVDSELLASGSALQSVFQGAGKELLLREAEDNNADTLFLGLYGDADKVEPYLTKVQVSLLITTADAIELDEVPGSDPVLLGPADPVTGTQAVTQTLELTSTFPAAPFPSESITATGQVTPTLGGRLRVGPVGELAFSGTAMFLVQVDGTRQVMTVLAETDADLQAAVVRLVGSDLQGCLLHKIEGAQPGWLALCPMGDDGGEYWEEGGQEPVPEDRTSLPLPPEPAGESTPAPVPIEPEDEPADGSQGRILVISLDDGRSRYQGRTGAEDYAAILQGSYDVTIWSKSEDPPLDTSKLPEYDLVIWTGGDFENALGDVESELLFVVVLNGTPVLVSGAYVGEGGEQSVQRDVRVEAAGHPLAQGFLPGEIIRFVSAPPGVEYEIDVQDRVEDRDGQVVFVRGPDSQDAGSSSIWVVEDDSTDVQIVFIGFPIYLLPEEARSRLVLNAADWMLNP